MRLLQELDERQVRLGYVNCVVLVAGRHLDVRQALRRRFSEYVFRPIYEGEPEWTEFRDQIDRDGLATLDAQEAQRSRARVSQHLDADPLAALRRSDARRFNYSSHLWLVQRCMISRLGPLAPDRAEVFLDHAKHLGLLTETHSLSEAGHVLQQLLLQGRPALREGKAVPNPLDVRCRRAVQVLHLRCLLASDAVTPFLLREVANGTAHDQLLRSAVDRLLASYERKVTVGDVRELKLVRDYRLRLDEGLKNRRHNLQPGKTPGLKIRRHHVRPRLEHFVDLELVGRRVDAGESVYVPTTATHAALAAWQSILEEPASIDRFLSNGFMGAAAQIYDIKVRPCLQDEAVYFFARAFDLVGREIGFTPGRTVALAACLIALEHGRGVEVDEMLQAVGDAAKTPLGEHILFSGGSRLDREFLVRVRPEIHDLLRSTGAAIDSATQHS